jgi:HD-like signal output (HDOD) protein/CheY-like chemotaxis protein
MQLDTLKALVVDDDPIARRTVGFALVQEGLQCAFANDGEEALRQIALDKFDLVVTDLRMPNKHGHALTIELLERPNPPVVVVHSSVDDPRMTKDLMARGVDDIIYKPANYVAFAAKAKALVLRRRQLSAKLGAGDSESTSDRLAGLGSGFVTITNDLSVRSPAGREFAPLARDVYEQRLSAVEQLLPLSAAAYDVFAMADSGETTTGKLVGALLQDATLTADVLRLANSAIYNRNQQPTVNIEEAVVRIGFKKVGEVALALNALGAFRSYILPWLDAEVAQARSLAAGVALERLCKLRGLRPANDGMTLCALLYPLERQVLGTALKDEYDALVKAAIHQNKSLRELERQYLPESGIAGLARVLSHWQVPADVWQPLCHAGDSYEEIAGLEEPLRTRVELIKLAIFAGEIAVGRWASWDEIEPPSTQTLARHQITDFTRVIEQTREDLQLMAESQKRNKRAASVDVIAAETSLRAVCYQRAGDTRNDWLPVLLASLGFETIPAAASESADVPQLMVNCLAAQSGELTELFRGEHRNWSKATFLAAAKDAPKLQEWGTVASLPTSVAALSALCDEIATDNLLDTPETCAAPDAAELSVVA